MKKTSLITASFVSLLSILSTQLHAATLNVSGGQLIGASGVTFGGATYNIVFEDISCIVAYSGCDEVTDFVFNDRSTVDLAETELYNQVFKDSAFEGKPELVNGCENLDRCLLITPYDLSGETSLRAGVLAIDKVPGIFLGGGTAARDFDFSSEGVTLANWSVVPIPAAAWLFGTALIGLVGFSRRRKIG